jgi:hypothetical protein
MLGYRPSPHQWTLAELFESIPSNAAFFLYAIILNEKPPLSGRAVMDAARKDFVATLDEQIELLCERAARIPEKEFQTRTVVIQDFMTGKLGAILVNTILKFLTGYRMQAFLYLKAAGRSELNSDNCWLGRDPK